MNIGDTYQQATKYARSSTPGGSEGLRMPEPYKRYPETHQRVVLPAPGRTGGQSVFDLLSRRRSVRRYDAKELTLAELSQMLWAGQGISRDTGRHMFRTAPSAGALYPIETYVLVNRVNGLTSGIYHYEIPRHRLCLVRTGNFGGELAHAALGQQMVADAPCTFIWSAVTARSKWKYGERAYRYMYMDAGHIAQNTALAAVSLEMGSCQIAAFFDDEINAMIGLDGKEETVIYLTAAGRPA
ncbi:MAG: SagB/ThcOx family dehydrogenase [Bacillota bacterium]|nr:SagB/ThcOx family dehydrogenase [Bacillota bacterium]MDW7685272.1 SagB/ThcOx family dehydrogenase [Bacillota bacterium]